MSSQKKPNGLNIIIVGCGRVGSTLVEQLSAEGHDITVIDKDAEKIRVLTDLYDIMGVVGNGASFGVQIEAGIKDANLIIAVTESDELNLLCCTVAKRVANCAAIARVRDPDYSIEIEYLREKLGLAMIINPELEASREMAKILCLPTALEIESFAHGQAELVKFKISKGNILDGISVASIGARTENILVCAIERGERVFIPKGDDVLMAGDIVAFVAPRKVARAFFKKIGSKSHQVKDTLIVGGGSTAYYLAKQLLHLGTKVTIIEKNKARCERLADLLPGAVIINGDGTDEELLREEGIESVESFVPLTDKDEENIFLNLYANRISKADIKVITRIKAITFKDIIDNLDLGSLVYPRYITTRAIIAYVRAKKASRSSGIETLSYIFNHRVEAIEFRVQDDVDNLTDVRLMDLNLKSNVLITFINRHGKIIIPSGQDCIKPGDTVMIATTQKGFSELTDILDK
ncbi:MAG: Trk system potassium transporter TrkA [Eubacterium sp.]|nr:Trk system potassium transporter TrkA [Eubacterium sp.]